MDSNVLNKEYTKRHMRRLKKTLDFLIKDNYENILDLGCYQGEISTLIKNACPQSNITMADIEEPIISVSSDRVKFIKIGDLNKEKLPFPDDSFDLVINLEMIEHLYDPDHLLTEIYRVLKSDGTLILSTPNLASWMNRILLLLGKFPRGLSISIKANLTGASDFLSRPSRESQAEASFDYHVRLYTPGVLKALFSIHHLKVIDTKGIYGFRSLQSNFVIKLVHIIAEKLAPSCAQFILIKAVAEK